MSVVVVSGPIASGKSTLGCVVAKRLREIGGNEGAAVDLDLVYEVLDPARRPKTDKALWSAARRLAGRLAAALLADQRSPVLEGDFAGEEALAELAGELPNGVQLRLVLLKVDFETAFGRASADRTRVLSRDKRFLAQHYGQFEAGWGRRQMLCIDTGQLTVDESADRVIAWLAAAT